MPAVDLTPAAHRLADLVEGVPEPLLSGSTPCPHYTVGDLIEHIGGFAVAFADAATKTIGTAGGPPPGGAARLAPGWSTRIPADLDALARAWQAPEAWTGMTRVGGIDLPASSAGLFALDELVVHGWDLARSCGRPYAADEASLAALLELLTPLAEPGHEAGRAGLFGPVVPVPDDAPALDRVVGLTGRDPHWVPSGF